MSKEKDACNVIAFPPIISACPFALHGSRPASQKKNWGTQARKWLIFSAKPSKSSGIQLGELLL